MNHTYLQHNIRTQQPLQRRGGVFVCPICDNVRVRGTWYADDSKLACLLNKPDDILGKKMCPACEMKATGLHEGVLKIHNIPYDLRDTVKHTILGAAYNITKYNSQDRILELHEKEDGYVVTTTRPSVAQKIGRVLNNQFDTYRIYSNYDEGLQHIYETSVIFTPYKYDLT